MTNLDAIKNILNTSSLHAQWDNIPIQPYHGIMIPLFSLRSNKSYGIGEFLDLMPLIDWVKSVGFQIIQLLPLNDSGEDPSPYNALSSCALNPIYLSLDALGNPTDTELLQVMKSLNNTHKIHYAKVKKLKYQYLEKYFQKYFSEIKTSLPYRVFCKKNPWLEAYTNYKVLKEKFNNQSWNTWPKNIIFNDSMQQRKEFFTLLQFLCFEQLSKVKMYADKCSVYLKGDIPILISYDSADVWANRELFNETFCVGAPPDLYNAQGQCWGFPLFNWPAHYEEDFSWWTQRLQFAENFYHIYRIDHVVGFFRLWAINKQTNLAVDGFYYPNNPYLWATLGKDLLSIITQKTTMLPIAEDLGTIPPYAFYTLKQLGICGTRVMRWERYWEENTHFIPLKNYSPISMTTVTTHDAEPLSLWWQKFPLDASFFCNQYGLKYREDFSFELRLKILRLSHQTESIFHINPLQEYLAFFPDFIWENMQEERINIPGTNSPNNWTYVLKKPLEDILSSQKLKDIMQNVLL